MLFQPHSKISSGSPHNALYFTSNACVSSTQASAKWLNREYYVYGISDFIIHVLETQQLIIVIIHSS